MDEFSWGILSMPFDVLQGEALLEAEKTISKAHNTT